MRAPLKDLHPAFYRGVRRSGIAKERLLFIAGYPTYVQFYEDVLRDRPVVATRLTIERLSRIADGIVKVLDFGLVTTGGRRTTIMPWRRSKNFSPTTASTCICLAKPAGAKLASQLPRSMKLPREGVAARSSACHGLCSCYCKPSMT